MAKKNSTKTATKEALQNSEPRIQTFKAWNGINIKEAPSGWTPFEDHFEFNTDGQTDLPANFLAIQNNIQTTSLKALETRNALTKLVPEPPENTEYTHVCVMKDSVLFVACDDGFVYYHDFDPTSSLGWQQIEYNNGKADYKISDLNVYQNTLICLGSYDNYSKAKMYDVTLNDSWYPIGKLTGAPLLDDPSTPPNLIKRGKLTEDKPSVLKMKVGYILSTKYGYTKSTNLDSAVVDLPYTAAEFDSNKYLDIEINISGYDTNEVKGIDIYAKNNVSNTEIFIGHIATTPGVNTYTLHWFGAMQDTIDQANNPMTIPKSNTTEGVHATHLNYHDGRLYFWGDPDKKYRLWIGGNAGNEMSICRGVGGAYVDIEPGSGIEVRHTHKFKTQSGANIVTIMCSNPNTNNVKRFNLVETNLTVTNEFANTGYKAEEVTNVIGCNSHYGSGVFADGLYSISRYGLTVTTQSMEYSSQLKSQVISDQVQPLFTNQLANRINNAKMIYSDGIIYIIFANDDDPTIYDRLILCYDVEAKAWFTYTIPLDENEIILHIFNFDPNMMEEGLGIITNNNIYCISDTLSDVQNLLSNSGVSYIIESGELAPQIPSNKTVYLAQLIFNFDYFVGDIEIVLDGIDYYGRLVNVKQTFNKSDIERDLHIYMRVNYLLENYRITIKGTGFMRMVSIDAKQYIQSNKLSLPYGFDTTSQYKNAHNKYGRSHHKVKDYNSLYDCLVT